MLSDVAEKAVLEVSLGERSYSIHIGPHLLAGLPGLCLPFLKRKKTVIVTDETVAGYYLKKLEHVFFAHDIACPSVVLPPGEATKSYAYLSLLCDQLLSFGVERGDTIIACGGGVIGDLCGFTAAVLRRGIDFIQVPTTLLSQVDSSVGGKTGINSPLGKNLIGAFHQPKLVVCDTDFLATLAERQCRSGYAEVVKYGLLGDFEFFTWLEHHGLGVLSGDTRAQIFAIRTSCAAKAAIVAQDEKESSLRALLNLGHTFGHALEAKAGYTDLLLHGEAVAIGIAMAFRFSHFLGLIEWSCVLRVIDHLKKMGLPTHFLDIEGFSILPEEFLDLMRQDKKTRDGKLTFILVRAIGEAFIAHDVPEAKVLNFLAQD